MTEGRAATHGADLDRDAKPADVVEAFLHGLQDGAVASAVALLDEDVAYTNVGMPTIRGRRRVERVLTGLARPQLGFEVYVHAIATEGSTVLTERTDVLTIGKVRAQFWVCGRFDLRDGRITLWRDYFDYGAVARAFLRGLVGAVVPAVRARPPQA
jgi:limonene-1,2-epoxide hydrolase